MDIDYNEQMLNYYPEIIKVLREFQALIKPQSLEIAEMHQELTKILCNAYISSADENTIIKWENMLKITPLDQGEDDIETWLNDRRETIIARLYSVENLNEQSISNIVKIFTGGSAISYFKNGTIYIMISPPENNKQYKFENVEQELRYRIPAHLSINVERNYYSWLQTKSNYSTWGDVKNAFDTWEDVLLKTSINN